MEPLLLVIGLEQTPGQDGCGACGDGLTWAFWCSGLRKLEPVMATSIQSTLRSSRLQMVPEDSMALMVGTDGPGERRSSGSIPHLPVLDFAQVGT